MPYPLGFLGESFLKLRITYIYWVNVSHLRTHFIDFFTEFIGSMYLLLYIYQFVPRKPCTKCAFMGGKSWFVFYWRTLLLPPIFTLQECILKTPYEHDQPTITRLESIKITLDRWCFLISIFTLFRQIIQFDVRIFFAWVGSATNQLVLEIQFLCFLWHEVYGNSLFLFGGYSGQDCWLHSKCLLWGFSTPGVKSLPSKQRKRLQMVPFGKLT